MAQRARGIEGVCSEMTADRAGLTDEAGRLAALGRYDVLDTPREPAFDRIVELVRLSLDVPISFISLLDERRQWFKASCGLDLAETPRRLSFCDRAIRRPEPLVIGDARADADLADNPYVAGAPFIRAYIGAPLLTPDGHAVGTLCAADTEPRGFGEREAAMMERFAGLVVNELELRQIAATDALTGLLTRGAFMDRLSGALSAGRGGRTALAIVDLDHFRRLNDTAGHRAGDDVLRAFAEAARATVPTRWSLGRIGGEEFAILAPGADAAHLAGLAETLRRAVETRVSPGRPEQRLTASFGIAESPRHGTTPSMVLAAADGALYRAKASGRNRCVVAETPASEGSGRAIGAGLERAPRAFDGR